MERRRAIFERIKETKLNKLTIKQGEINVKLNLKKDLIDPNVEINEKALEMLEAYAEKNAQLGTNESQNSDRTFCRELNQTSVETDSIEEFPQLTKDQKQNTGTFVDNSPKINASTSNELASCQETQEKEGENKKEHKCRLCKLKISSERALHEHVSRIHGGKGIFSVPSKKDCLKINEQFGDEDYDSSDINDLESQDEAYLSSSSETKRRKTNKPMLPRPNVAIRVAKVAYYNSKGTINSHNPFKSSIFKNGGLRGNFFSQERLPLRSCKIKMKITSNISKDEGPSDQFLMNIHEIIKSEYPEPNKTITLQSSWQDHATNDHVLTETEIKEFFKALLDYIPLNSTVRLEDLIKENELVLRDIGQHCGLDVSEIVRLIFEIILATKQFGINLFDLKREANCKIKKIYYKQIKMIVLKKILKILTDNHIVLAVGVIERVYVANEFKKHWVIESFKSLRGRGNRDDEDCSNDNQNDHENELQDTTMDKRAKETNASLKNFKPICIIPRPWRYIDGLLNRPVLKKMLESIILFLKTNPNASFSSISSHFCPVLQPIMTLELLEMLEHLKCVKKLTLKNENLCDLFSDFNNGSTKIDQIDDMQGDEIHNYYLTQNSIFNIKKIFPN
ncbi:General transcription factor 3C polypeptide [Brachionus plicatilis]|uniref:General transcription factor 3C polypeptide n=1 Tax=Brachionus plicatilis TaxID=10195 RepID=A0A3M7T9K5_BRAPC|nr:General transcription factor 3C polypeptide [Brachionus plicatilis]